MKTNKSKIVGKKELLALFPVLEETMFTRADDLFPVRITRSWLKRVKSLSGPLGIQAFPNSWELSTDAEDLLDPVGEEALTPHPWLIQKHPDRILFITTRRCHLYCRYCFRRNHTGAEDPSEQEFDSAINFINHQSYQECILSGGDPLALSPNRLEMLLKRLQTPTIRIHTRAPITDPSVVRPKLLELLRGREGLWVIVHCNHPKEISAEVEHALYQIRQLGIPILNQAVLLKGVNDCVDTLAELCTRLVSLQVFPYYLHHTDFAAGNVAFRVSLERGFAIYQQLRQRVSGIALPKYVIDPPDGSGKIEVETYMRKQHGTS